MIRRFELDDKTIALLREVTADAALSLVMPKIWARRLAALSEQVFFRSELPPAFYPCAGEQESTCSFDYMRAKGVAYREPPRQVSASGIVDDEDPDANMYGCLPCPRCGSQYRASFQRVGGSARDVACDECGFREPAVDRETLEKIEAAFRLGGVRTALRVGQEKSE